MANEITATATLNITLTGQTASGTTTFQANLTGDFVGEEQDIGITSETLGLGDITLPKVVYIRNMDTTNFVQVDSATTFDKFPQKIYPGQAVLLLPETATIYIKADTAPLKIFTVAG
jgi:hypothetical protein